MSNSERERNVFKEMIADFESIKNDPLCDDSDRKMFEEIIEKVEEIIECGDELVEMIALCDDPNVLFNA